MNPDIHDSISFSYEDVAIIRHSDETITTVNADMDEHDNDDNEEASKAYFLEASSMATPVMVPVTGTSALAMPTTTHDSSMVLISPSSSMSSLSGGAMFEYDNHDDDEIIGIMSSHNSMLETQQEPRMSPTTSFSYQDVAIIQQESDNASRTTSMTTTTSLAVSYEDVAIIRNDHTNPWERPLCL